MDDIMMLKSWLLHSGIQNLSEDEKCRGGFHGWYDPSTKSYPYLYTEITGYGITTLLYLYELEQDPVLLERAELAANWIIRIALTKEGGVRTRYYFNESNDRYTFDKGWLVTFDTGMALFGLSKLYKITRKKEYLDAAKAMGEFILRMQKPDGGIAAHYDLLAQEPYDAGDRWSTQSGAYHAKVAMGLLELSGIAHDDRFEKAAKALCSYALTLQQPDGRFVTTQHDGATLQHPHCYAAEGLLYCGLALKDQSYIDAAAKAAEWSLSTQLTSGGIPQIYENNTLIAQERTDILAQVLRLASYFDAAGISSESNKRHHLKQRLLSFQNKQQLQAGGIAYGYERDGKKYDHLNSWCSMFAIQALLFSKQAQEGTLPSVAHLV